LYINGQKVYRNGGMDNKDIENLAYLVELMAGKHDR